MKMPALEALPSALVTLTLPLDAPAGTVVLICVLEATVKTAVVPLKVTLVVPMKLLPVMVTAVPTGPLVGVKEVIEGGRVTVKSPPLVAVPSALVTLIFPVVAPEGTVVLICAFDVTVKAAVAPLKRTLVVPVKLLPVIVTAVPIGPPVGVKKEIEGGRVTVKSPLLVAVPSALVTLILAVDAPV